MQLGFHFDQTRCTGCHACAVACKDWNDIPAGSVQWRRITPMEEGDWPDLFAAYLSTSCHHCEDPLCAVVCPAQAISKREEDGIVLVDQDRCRQAATCGIITNCGDIPFGESKSPCTMACPAGVNVQGYVGLIAKGRFQEALDLIRRDLPLPSVCGRACTHPCEDACSRRKLDDPVAIMELKRFVTDQETPLPDPLPITKRQKVAIVGSGPAGLSAAWSLARKGYRVTVFEALPVAGGMLSVGLPEYRLPKKILRRDLDYLEALGIRILTNSPVGENPAIHDLKKQGYDAVFLSAGAHGGQRLSIPGSDLKGVLEGVSFLREIRLGKDLRLGNRVLVLGGGRVALDCARTAFRLGASQIHLACVEDRDSMRATPEEIMEAEEEGIIIHDSLSFRAIHGKDGRAHGVECLDVRSFHFEENGRLRVKTVPGSEKIHEADTVIFAVGQSADLERFQGIEVSSAGTISVHPQTMGTSIPGVFAGGEAASGPMSIIEAVAAGKAAAASMDAYLQGLVFRNPPLGIGAAEIEIRIPSGIAKQCGQAPRILDKARRRSWEEISMGFSEEAAITEARRCLNCAGHLCREVCPYRTPQFGPDQDSRMQMCNLCIDRWNQDKKPICVSACPTRAMDAGPLDELKARYGDDKEAHGFAYNYSTKPSIRFKARLK